MPNTTLKNVSKVLHQNFQTSALSLFGWWWEWSFPSDPSPTVAVLLPWHAAPNTSHAGNVTISISSWNVRLCGQSGNLMAKVNLEHLCHTRLGALQAAPMDTHWDNLSTAAGRPWVQSKTPSGLPKIHWSSSMRSTSCCRLAQCKVQGYIQIDVFKFDATYIKVRCRASFHYILEPV